MTKKPVEWLFAILLALVAATTAQARDLTYTGTLGTQSVVVELTTDDHGTIESGRYFYLRHHLDLMLEAQTATADHAVLSEGPEQSKPRPQLTLDRQADGGWRGTWRSPQGKTLPVTLAPAALPPLAADTPDHLRELRSRRPYDYLRLTGLDLRAGKRQTFMGHALQWRVEPVSGMTLFTIADGYPSDQLARINRVLVDRQWAEIDAWFTCRDNRFGEGDYQQTVTPRLLTPNLVSISVFTSYYCGGAHPDFGDVPINLDARTAQPLALEDLLWLGTGTPLHYATDAEGNPIPGSASFDAWSDYRGQVLAPWLAKQWKRLYARELASAQSENECGYDDPGVWQFVGWHMTPKGIFLSPSFARVARACEANDDWSLLPWNIVRQHPGRLGVRVLPGK